MVNLKISVPIYELSAFNKLAHHAATVEISSDVDSLSEGYTALKSKINDLLRDANLQARLAGEIGDLEATIAAKKGTLEAMESRIQRATEQYERLREFLRNMGIEAADSYLTYHPNYLSGSHPKTVEVIGDDDDNEY
jgi:chromosome segregation ATPase